MNLLSNTRLLLLTLCLGFACTALILHYSFNEKNIVAREGRRVEQNLHEKEELIYSFLNKKPFFDSLKNIQNNTQLSESLISELKDQHLIYLQAFKQGKVSFYNGIRVYFKTDQYLKEGSSFLSTKNGFYEVIKKSEGDYSVVFYIPIKTNYPYQNQYLKNDFSPDLIGNNHLELAGLNDREVVNIRNKSGKYLFSVKFKPTPENHFYSGSELWAWIFSAFFGLLFFNQFCRWLVRIYNFKTGFITLCGGIIGFRLLSLWYGILPRHFNLQIFDPKNYAENLFFPSLGELLFSILAFNWIFLFFYLHQAHLKIFTLRKQARRVLLAALMAMLLFFGVYAFNELLFSLIYNSNINLDLSNIVSLTGFSWLGIGIICLSLFGLFILVEIVLTKSIRLNLSWKNKPYTVLLILVIVSLLYQLITFNLNALFLVFPVVAGIQNWFKLKHTKIAIQGIVAIVLLGSFAVSIQLTRFKDIKERESRKLLAQRLESPEDPNAVLLFLNKENKISHDEMVADFFRDPLINHQILINRLQKLYFDGYLSRYDFKAYEFYPNGNPVILESEFNLDHFKNLVLSGSVKVSQYFYRVTNNYGFQSYFAIIPIIQNKLTLGTLAIELRTKPMDEINTFPQLLMDGKVELDMRMGDYSYAFYHLNELNDQHGEYIYDLVNKQFKGKNNDFVFVSGKDHTGKLYNHLIYQPNEWKIVVVSKKAHSLVESLASASSLFLLLLIFGSLVYLLNEIVVHQQDWKKLFLPINLLYKTRIQLSLLAAVVFTLVITGFITFYNISKQYRSQQEENILEKVKEMASGIKNQFLKNDTLALNEQTQIAIEKFAEISRADLNLFDKQGDLLFSTQPKFYESGLITPKINALAFIYLSQSQVSEYIGHEKIGKLNYLTGYVPIKNSKNRAIAYLGFPYFSNEQDYQIRIGTFLNALINFYAIILVFVGFVALFIANQITNPLSLIQKSLSLTKIGRKNKSIKWNRKDEIGNLINEYNNMILALEESARKLAQSERETAWREMAKQVAHEIKNPLTPLKLGVQLLQKAWEEKDPDFNQKFEKFSKSFIEQIESLSHIASEFSNFAKMPDIVLEKIDLKQILEQSIEVYQQLDNIRISLTDNSRSKIWVNADRDQLLRAFNNLIKNAVEAMPDGRKGEVQIDLSRDPKHAYIDISDNGAGIPESLREQIFVPNFTTKSSGTGLGLAFVKQCLKSIGGSITFETSAQKGTTFYISIPLTA
ncbi:MAG: ATP-binding protein [Sphingobacteriaceae bacterium]